MQDKKTKAKWDWPGAITALRKHMTNQPSYPSLGKRHSQEASRWERGHTDVPQSPSALPTHPKGKLGTQGPSIPLRTYGESRTQAKDVFNPRAHKILSLFKNLPSQETQCQMNRVLLGGGGKGFGRYRKTFCLYGINMWHESGGCDGVLSLTGILIRRGVWGFIVS